jgi:two-component system nitrogen regulation response regulator GlnG
MVVAGAFRRDLYERLKVVVIRLPPLRERREEIRPLVQRFVASWNEQYKEHRFVSEPAMALLEAHPWPGNVRGLNNALRSAANTATTDALGPEAFPDDVRQSLSPGGNALPDAAYVPMIPPEGVNLKARLLQVEWSYYSAALRMAEGRREAAARLLGMTGHAFRKALRERLSAFADEGWEEGM